MASESRGEIMDLLFEGLNSSASFFSFHTLEAVFANLFKLDNLAHCCYNVDLTNTRKR